MESVHWTASQGIIKGKSNHDGYVLLWATASIGRFLFPFIMPWDTVQCTLSTPEILLVDL